MTPVLSTFRSLLLGLSLLCAATTAAQTKSAYDPKLADSLGGEPNGMKQYVLVILKTGPTVENDKAKRDSLFKGHFANMERMVAQGKLLVAGPIQKNERQYRGIFILNVKTIAEAEALVANDSAVSSGVLAPEYYLWYGSAALPMYLPYADKVTKPKN
ncbi:YciI family protein [Flaviaesturariibacter amylovorans]|uniref:YCII-related domain-containing protein n=1 Tax=Flaviaesturariibacter amylovorans TaxID=1084520 RepID=A0ABP8HCK1_9BACT